MTSRWGGAIGLVALLACNGLIGLHAPTEITPAFVSGTRLRARFYDGGNGARLLVGWHDAGLGEDCAFIPAGFGSFVLATDGVLRCLPQHSEAFPQIGYADPACTIPIVTFMDISHGIPSHVVGAGRVASCSVENTATAPVFEVGADAGLGQNPVTYVDNAGQCQPGGSGGIRTTRLLGPEVDPKTFVGATDMDVVRDARFSVRYHVMEDGAREAYAIVDTQRGERCTDGTELGTAAKSRCYPEQHAEGHYFEDSACTTPLLESAVFSYGAAPADPRCVAPRSGLLIPPDFAQACDDPVFVEVGAPESVTQTYVGTSAHCFAVPPTPSPPSQWRVGDAIPDEAFGTIQTLHVGAGRLTRAWIGTASSVPLIPSSRGPFYDTQLKLPCGPSPATSVVTGGGGGGGGGGGSSGSMPPAPDPRCVPSPLGALSTTSAPVFADAACTQPLVSVAMSCGVAAPPAIVSQSAGAGTTQYNLVGPELAPPVVYREDVAGCSVAPPDPATAYFALGAVVDPAAFPKLPLVTE